MSDKVEKTGKMKQILIIGTGRVSGFLVQYLAGYSKEKNWKLIVADQLKEAADKVIAGLPNCEALQLNVFRKKLTEKAVSKVDLVISLLPPRYHFLVYEHCLKYRCSFLTASYEAEDPTKLNREAKEKGILLLNEMGLNPGLDHCSAMRVIHRLKSEGHRVVSFESFTGSLPAPESDDNPWHYRFSWNPRNVVLSGQDVTVKFLQKGQRKYIPYHKVFRRTEKICIPGYCDYEAYANRDSLRYIPIYGLEEAETVFRGTIRGRGFCRAWDVFVQLGATDDSFIMELSKGAIHRDFINAFLMYHPTDSVELKFMHYMGLDPDSEVMEKLDWLGIFEKTPIGLDTGTPAQILEHILKKKWSMKPQDLDLVVMWHQFEFEDKNTREIRTLHSYLVVKREEGGPPAISKTVGLPLGIAARLYLDGEIKVHGCVLPTIKEIYNPVLNELEKYGIRFIEQEKNEGSKKNS